MKDRAIQQMRIGAMLIIVFYHCLCYYGIWDEMFPVAHKYECIEYWRALCNVALNAFVFISGLLYAKLYVTKEKYRNRKKMFKDKAGRLLFPYFIWATIALLLFPSNHPLDDFMNGAQHLWFLLMLMTVFVIAIAAGHSSMNINILIGGATIFIILNVALAKYGSILPNYVAWQTSVRYLPAFICGILTVRLEIAEKMARWTKSSRILAFVIASLLVVYIGYSPSLPLGLLYMNIPTYCFLICLYAFLSSHPIQSGQRTLDSLDKHSMGIYIIHHLLIWSFLLFIPEAAVLMDKYYIAAPIILFVTALSISWLLSAFLNRHSYTKLLFNAYVKPTSNHNELLYK